MARVPETKKGGGESHRTARVEREIRGVVGTYLVGGFRGQLPGLVSLTRVSVSADLKIANLNFTLIITQNEGEDQADFEKREKAARKDTVKELNAYAKDVQAELAHRLEMRYTPKVTFFYDEGFENALKVERLLRDMSGQRSAGVASSDGSDSDDGT